MKTILKMLTLFLLISTTLITADTNTSKTEFIHEGQIILKTITTLETKGYMTSKNANEARTELVFQNTELIKQAEMQIVNKVEDNSNITWTEYLSFINIIKMFAILGFLFVFRGIIMNFIFLFAKIPVALYQVVLLYFSLNMTFYSEVIWESQAFYLSNFGVVANIMVLAWIVESNPDWIKKILKIFTLNLPLNILAGFYLMIYFGFFSIYFESTFLGLLSVISFSAMFSFVMGSTGVCTFIGYEKDDYMNISMVVNGIILLAYSFVMINNIPVPYIEYFSIGIEYVCSLAFIVVLLLNGSFYSKGDVGFVISVLLMFISFALALAGIYLFNLSVIPVIINTGFFIFILGWVGYFSVQISALFSVFIVSALLYGFALMVESHPELFVTSLF